METKSESPCCCSASAGDDAATRRGFVAGAIAAVSLAVPAVVGLLTALNPLCRKGGAGVSVRLTSLDVLSEDGTPQKFPVIADRVDAWNRLRNQPIGAVFLRRLGPEEVEAVNVICPHAGCAVQYADTPEGGKYFCPCYSASFALDRQPLDEPSPSPRALDELKATVTDGEVWVEFINYKTGTAKQEPLA